MTRKPILPAFLPFSCTVTAQYAEDALGTLVNNGYDAFIRLVSRHGSNRYIGLTGCHSTAERKMAVASQKNLSKTPSWRSHGLMEEHPSIQTGLLRTGLRSS